MTYQVKSLPIAEVLRDLAEATGGTVRVDANYYTLDLPAAVGEGVVSGIDFGHGLGMINYRCTFHRTTEIHFTLNTVHPLKFVYVHAGSVAHRFAEESVRQELRSYQNLVVASRRQNGHVLYFPGKQSTTICSVEIDRKRFTHRFIGKFGSNEVAFRDLLTDTGASRQFCYAGEYALRISEMIESMLSFDRGGVLRSMFYEGLSYTILVTQWQQYLEDQQRTQDRKLLRRASLARITSCMDYIGDNLAAELTTTALAARAEISEAQLQKGFQHVAGMSVNQYVRERRLEHGMDLLRSGRYNVSETLYRVGFSSLSYFSRKFKERYGVTPSALRRTQVGEKSTD